MSTDLHKKRGRGQPTKCTENVREKVAQAIRAGQYLTRACEFAGISYQSHLNWMERGEKEADLPPDQRSQYFDYFVSIKKADVDVEVRVITQWQQHMADNWQACAEFASRRWPERWSRYSRIDTNQNPTVTDMVKAETVHENETIDDVVRRYMAEIQAASSSSSK